MVSPRHFAPATCVRRRRARRIPSSLGRGPPACIISRRAVIPPVGEQQMYVNNPTLSTTPDQTSVTLGPPVTLKDTADLEGGFNPKGSITFTLVGPDGTTVVDTEMVLVNGNGLYSTPTGL